MKIKLKTLYILIIILLVILNEKYFFLIKNFKNWIFALIIITFILVFWILLKKSNNNFYFRNFIITFLIMNLITMSITILKYDQPVELAISKYKFITIILLYFPLKQIVEKIGTNKLDRIIIVIAILGACIMIIQKHTYGQITIINGGVTLRNGEFRNFQIQHIVSIAIIILTQYLFLPIKDYKFKSNKKILILLFPLVYYTISISMTRSYGMAILGTILIMIWMNIKSRISKSGFRIYFNIFSFFMFGFLVFLCYKYVIEIFSYSISMNESSSIQRIGAINYYVEKFIENPLFGYGLYDTSYEYGLIITGANLRYYADDVGVFGYIFQYGIMGIALLIYFVLLINKKIRGLNKYNKNKYMAICIYFITLLPFNILFNLDTGMFYLCLFMVGIEDCYGRNRGLL